MLIGDVSSEVMQKGLDVQLTAPRDLVGLGVLASGISC